jgi:transcriptional regulator with XRE-family HTH domain
VTDKRRSDAAYLGAKLRETREYLGLSQRFVADNTGIPRTAISDIERGVRRVESLELKRLAKLFRYPVSYFLGDESQGPAGDATLTALTRAAEDLTDSDRQEVLRFAEFLRNYATEERKT